VISLFEERKCPSRVWRRGYAGHRIQSRTFIARSSMESRLPSSPLTTRERRSCRAFATQWSHD